MAPKSPLAYSTLYFARLAVIQIVLPSAAIVVITQKTGSYLNDTSKHYTDIALEVAIGVFVFLGAVLALTGWRGGIDRPGWRFLLCGYMMLSGFTFTVLALARLEIWVTFLSLPTICCEVWVAYIRSVRSEDHVQVNLDEDNARTSTENAGQYLQQPN